MLNVAHPCLSEILKFTVYFIKAIEKINPSEKEKIFSMLSESLSNLTESEADIPSSQLEAVKALAEECTALIQSEAMPF